MIKFFRKLVRLKREKNIAPRIRISALQTIVNKAKDEVDEIIDDRVSLCLVTPLKEASWQELIVVDEKGRFRNAKPNYLKRTMRQLEEREFPSIRMYGLDVNYIRQKDAYVEIYKRGKIKNSYHFPLIAAERVVGEIIIYSKGEINQETNQKLTNALRKHEKNLSEIISANFR
jgi:hypothetical protein